MSDLLDEILSGDRVVYSFVSIWVAAAVVWIVLDWAGNPNRGRFHPAGERESGTRSERRQARRRRRAEEDAAVRATLRDAYGASSLRYTWSRVREARALAADDALVRPDPRSRPARPPARPPVRLAEDRGAAEPPLRTWDPDEPFVPEPSMPRGRWRVGLEPLMLSKAGKPPTAATLRTRVWKNHAHEPGWGAANQRRMQAGKPPRRFNPVLGKVETGVVDLTTTDPGWKPVPATDPFGGAS